MSQTKTIFDTLVITGASGYLGSELLKHIKHYELRLSDQIVILNRQNINYNRLKEALSTNSACIHMAHMKDMQAEKDFIDSIYESNKEVYFIYFSSAAVYGEAINNGAHNTRDNCKPINDYGHYKLEIENYIQAKFKNHLILRISNPYGKEPEGKKSFYTIVKEKISQEQSLEIHSESPNQIIRDFIYIDDCIEKIYQLTKAQAHGIHNVSSGKGLSLEEFIKLNFSEKLEIKYTGFKAAEIKHSVLI